MVTAFLNFIMLNGYHTDGVWPVYQSIAVLHTLFT